MENQTLSEPDVNYITFNVDSLSPHISPLTIHKGKQTAFLFFFSHNCKNNLNLQLHETSTQILVLNNFSFKKQSIELFTAMLML